MTDQPASLVEALSRLQCQLPRIVKESTAQIPGKDGKRGYEYKYADLATISHDLLPLMGMLGLAFTSAPTIREDGRLVLAYRLWHVTGDHIGGDYPLPSTATPQQVGSAITYARRYCLCAVTGLVADEDDDGAAAEDGSRRLIDEARAMRRKDPEVDATGAATQAEITRMSTGPEPGTERGRLDDADDLWATGLSGLAPETDPEDLHGTATADQIKMLQIKFTEHGIGKGMSDQMKRAAKVAWLVHRFGPDIHSSKDLSYTQAAQALQELA